MSLFTVIATSKIAASAIAAGTLAVGGTGAAAFAGALPTDIQQSAHELLGAPAPKVDGISDAAAAAESGASAEAAAEADAESGAKADADASSKSGVAAGVDAIGPAAYGLCTAFAEGGLATSSEGFASLSIAAGGEASIESYCAEIEVPGQSANAQADVAGSAAAKVDVPAVPELPTNAAVPAAPELPAEVPTDAADIASSAVRH